MFNLPVLYGDVSTQYKIDNKYVGVTYNETQPVMITEQQHSTCLHTNGQFCKIHAPFQALTNSPSCIAALYAKNDQEIHVQCSKSIFHTLLAFPPIVITSNLWIFILTPTMQESAITIVCPDKVKSSITVPAATSYPEVTTSLQCYIKALPPAPKLQG